MKRRGWSNLGHKKFGGIFLLILLLMNLSFSWLKSAKKENVAFHFLTQDSVVAIVYEVLDADSNLEMYKARIKTPVCENKVCYEVELIFYWDLIGNFKKYELVAGKSLTKLEHKPFSDADYQKLSEILSNKYPAFINLKKDELITKVVTGDIDGVSGATVAAIKGQIVPGAAYSCYTLWHIANGTVADSIKKHTRNRLNENIVRKLALMKNNEAHYFLINSLNDAEFQTYLPEVLGLIRNNEGYNEGYFAKNAIEKIPFGLFSSSEVQDFFSEHFENLGYFAQMSLLKKLQGNPISDDLAKILIKNLDNPNYSFQNELIIKLICFNVNNLETETTRELIDEIIESGMVITTEIYKAIVSLEKKEQWLKKDISDFKRYYKTNMKFN
jgi:hypothetical protein